MSATGRSDVRRLDDFYATPAWCVYRLLEAVDIPGGLWLEPCAGDGAIMRAVADKRQDVRWHAVEIRTEFLAQLYAIESCRLVADRRFQSFYPSAENHFDLVLGNPPYNSAMEFVIHALRFSERVIFLLRLNWLAGKHRAAWITQHLTAVYVIPDRPSFTDSGTDAADYAWMCFARETSGPATLQVLAVTPSEQRRPTSVRVRHQLELLDGE